MGLFNLFHHRKKVSSDTAKNELEKRYKDKGYNTIPYIENNDADFVISHSELNVGVPKQYMEPINFGDFSLLRGEIIALWWLNNPRTNKSRTPKYFSRDYGINLTDSLDKLEKLNLIDSNKKLTPKGLSLLKSQNQIVMEHRAVKSYFSDGSIHYDFSKLLKGEEKKKAMLNDRLYWFDRSLKNGINNGYRFYKWQAMKNCCDKCKKASLKDNGYGPGIYDYKQAKALRNIIHYDCRCSLSETWVDGQNNNLIK